MRYPLHYTVTVTQDPEQSDHITHIGIASTQYAGLETKIAIPVTDGQPDYTALVRDIPVYVRTSLLPVLYRLVTALQVAQLAPPQRSNTENE